MIDEERERLVERILHAWCVKICEDANDCTSFEEEIRGLIRRGGPRLDDLTDVELMRRAIEVMDDKPDAEDA